jgi:hypothetical protein
MRRDMLEREDQRGSWVSLPIPSGKRLHNYGKSQFLIGKSTVNGHFQ